MESIIIYNIYLITNLVNNKKYVGITSQGIDKRFKGHLRNAFEVNGKNCLSYALRKHGIENFKLELLESEIPLENGEEKEKFYIQKYNSYYKNNCGYNMTIGGNGTVGYIFTDEVRNKISISGKGRKFSKERNEKIRQVMLNREFTEEWKKRISESRLGKNKGKDNHFFGRKHTEESKQKMSQANKGKIMSEEFKKHQSEIHKGIKFTEEHKQKLSQNNGSSREVVQLDLNFNVLNTFKSMKEAERQTGIKTYGISSCCNNHQKTSGGYMWKYKESVSTNCRMDDELPSEAHNNSLS